MAALLLGAGLAAAAYARTRVTEAVVIEPQAVVRYGPLDESQVAFQLRDGSEVIVLDAKVIAVGDRKQTWLEVREAAGRAGWIKRDQVVILE